MLSLLLIFDLFSFIIIIITITFLQYLRRPPEKNEEFRLDRLLQKKAMEGVMIYVVVYKEVSLALTLDSAHTKIWLQDLHPNIQGK